MLFESSIPGLDLSHFSLAPSCKGDWIIHSLAG